MAYDMSHHVPVMNSSFRLIYFCCSHSALLLCAVVIVLNLQTCLLHLANRISILNVAMHYWVIIWLIYSRLQQRPFNGLWSGTTRVGHTHPDHRASFITFLHLQWPMACSLFNLRAWQSSRTTSFQVFFGLPLGLEPSTWCSIHFFTQSSSSFRNTRPYQRSLFCCYTSAMSSTRSLSLSSLLGSLSFSVTPLIHLTILICACWIATTFSFLTGQVSLPCNMLLLTQLLYHLPLIIRDTSLLVSSGRWYILSVNARITRAGMRHGASRPVQ